MQRCREWQDIEVNQRPDKESGKKKSVGNDEEPRRPVTVIPNPDGCVKNKA